MKTGYVYEGDDWVQGGEMIASPEKLAKIAAVVERTDLIVEHRHYRGASAPAPYSSKTKKSSSPT